MVTIKVADLAVGIEGLSLLSELHCKPFLTDDPPKRTIRLTEEDVARAARSLAGARNPESLRHGPGRSKLEMAAALRLLAEVLPDEGVFLFHGAVIALDGEGLLFSAPSGTGKSTHVLRWLECCPEAFVLNGDKPFIRVSGDGALPLAYGTPWAGKENLYVNAAVPLKAIVLMERTEDNRMDPVSFPEAFPALLAQVYHPEDEARMRRTLQLLRLLHPAVSFWRFRFNNLKDDCFPTAYRALTGRDP